MSITYTNEPLREEYNDETGETFYGIYANKAEATAEDAEEAYPPKIAYLPKVEMFNDVVIELEIATGIIIKGYNPQIIRLVKCGIIDYQTTKKRINDAITEYLNDKLTTHLNETTPIPDPTPIIETPINKKSHTIDAYFIKPIPKKSIYKNIQTITPIPEPEPEPKEYKYITTEQLKKLERKQYYDP
jgi:hypothetical protein